MLHGYDWQGLKTWQTSHPLSGSLTRPVTTLPNSRRPPFDCSAWGQRKDRQRSEAWEARHAQELMVFSPRKAHMYSTGALRNEEYVDAITAFKIGTRRSAHLEGFSEPVYPDTYDKWRTRPIITANGSYRSPRGSPKAALPPLGL